MAGFRIVCDLSNFFVDVRSKSFLYVDLTKYRKIIDLVNHIKDTFNLNFPISLVLNDLYLPYSEDIRVLQSNDELKVFKIEITANIDSNSLLEPTKKTKKKRKKEKLKLGTSDVGEIPLEHTLTDEADFTEVIENVTNNRKRKHRCSENGEPHLVDSKISNRKSIDSEKCVHSSKYESTDVQVEHSHELKDAVNVENKITKSKCQKKIQEDEGEVLTKEDSNKSLHVKWEAHPANGRDTDLIEVLNNNEGLVEQYSCENNVSNVEQVCKDKKKRKRTRIRTRKRNNVKVDTSVDVTQNKSFDISTIHAHSSKKHVRYDDVNSNYTNDLFSDQILELNHLTNGKQEVECSDLPVVESERKTSATEPSSDISDSRRNNSVAGHENASHNLPFDKILSLQDSNPIVIKRIQANKSPLESTPPKQILLQKIPSLDEVISFKILKLGENYCPQLSSTIVAKVIYSDASTQQLTLKVLAGLDQCQQPRGVFSLDEEIDSEPTDIVHFNWQELIGASYSKEFV